MAHEVINEFLSPKLGLDIEPYLKDGDLVGLHHLSRYHFACKVLKERNPSNVIDIGCGAGYGSFLMASSNPDMNIVGADYDYMAISESQKTYYLPNLRFCVGDIVNWNGLGAYDCVICFDTIEHVSHREIMMMNIVDHLSDNGFLLLSTPTRRKYIRLRPRWRKHKIEFDQKSLYDFLSRYFSELSLYISDSVNIILCEKLIKIPWVRRKLLEIN